jgi:hypothetical protein
MVIIQYNTDGNSVNLVRNRIEWKVFAINTLTMNESFVYLWRDSLKNRYYLGYHSGYNPNYICSSKYMLAEYKTRPQDFKRRILRTGTSKEMDKLEKRLLKSRYKHFGSRYYNLALSFPIYKRTDYHIQNLVNHRTGKKASMETRKKIADWNLGRKHSAETILKMSATKKGKRFSKSHKEKLSMAHKGNVPWNLGVPHSEEVKRKLKEAWVHRKLKVKVS